MLTVLIIITVFMLHGCFKEIVEKRGPLPDIIWPNPPDIPRIRFVNSISRPKDYNIRKSGFDKIFRFLKGEKPASLINPYGVLTDHKDRLFVVDTSCPCVHVFDVENNVYYTFPDGDTSFLSPIDIALDSEGMIYVSDSKDGVVKVFNNGGKEFVKEIGRSFLVRPTGLVVNNVTGELLVVDTVMSQILKYNLEGLRFKGDIGSVGSINGMFHYPTNIFLSKDGKIFVTDSLNFRIQIFTSEGTFIRAFGQAGDRPGYFSRPRGVAVDSDGNIYVVDALFDNVQMFNSEGRLLMDFGGTGSEYGKFWLPTGIFIDERDRIYVSDAYNKRVQVFQYMKSEELIQFE
ncbi:MAG: 6-bladed beta-propeller [Nitrospiraceae bacterium]|nr:MAG: 6-bladed beta-propeller [Nitrospiraceae bacterium]